MRLEIVQSEEVYAANLQILLYHYIRPILASGEALGFSMDRTRSLFSNTEAIANFHQVRLPRRGVALRPSPSVRPPVPTRAAAPQLFLGDLRVEAAERCFLKNAAFMRMYTDYVSQYDGCMAALIQLQTNQKFQNLLDKIRLHPV